MAAVAIFSSNIRGDYCLHGYFLDDRLWDRIPWIFEIQMSDNCGYGVPAVGSLRPIQLLVYCLTSMYWRFVVRDFRKDLILFFLAYRLARDYFENDQDGCHGFRLPIIPNSCDD